MRVFFKYLLLVASTLMLQFSYAQPEWIDPIKIMENAEFKDVDTIQAFMQFGEQELMVYEKTYYKEPSSMRSMRRYDHDKKTVFISEYSPDSSAYAERIRNERMKVIYAIEWKKDEDGRIVHQSKSEKKGRRLLIFNTDTEYKFDKKERLIKSESVYYLDNFDNYKRKTITKYKYNDLDSVVSESQLTRRGLKVLHTGSKIYEYDPNGRLLHKVSKTNNHKEESFYEYDEKNRVSKIRIDAGKAFEEIHFEYYNGRLTKKFIYSFDGVTPKYNSWSYSPTGKILGFCENRDSIVYQRIPNDSLISITKYVLDKDDEVKAEVLMMSQEFKNYRVYQKNSFEERHGEMIERFETFDYDDVGRLIKYTSEETVKGELLNNVIKTYKYDSRGYVSQYTIERPLSGLKRLFYYSITF